MGNESHKASALPPSLPPSLPTRRGQVGIHPPVVLGTHVEFQLDLPALDAIVLGVLNGGGEGGREGGREGAREGAREGGE